MDLIKRDDFIHKRSVSFGLLVLLTGYVLVGDRVNYTWVVPAYAFLLTMLLFKKLWLAAIMAIVAFVAMRMLYRYYANTLTAGMLDRIKEVPEYTLDDQLPDTQMPITTDDPIVQEQVDEYQDQKERELDDQVYINANGPIPLKPGPDRGISFTDGRLIGEALDGIKSLIPTEMPFIENDKPVKCVTPIDPSVTLYSRPNMI